MKFHHIGIATGDLAASAQAYEALGYAAGPVIHDPVQRVDLCFLEKPGMPMLELVCPADETSPVGNLLKKNGTIPYHTCYEVDELETEMKRLRAFRFLVVVAPVPAVAFQMRRICFLFNKATGLVELLEGGE